MKFSVKLIGTANRGVFREVSETIQYGLAELGHDCVLTNRWLPDRRIILLCPFAIATLGVVPPAGTILYNLEQVFVDSPFFTPTILSIFRRYPVVDYSKQNIERLGKMGVSARWLPIGYVQELTRIQSAPEEDIDVLFYGGATVRRLAVLDTLAVRGLRVKLLNDVYGAARDDFIARSKVVLNMHNSHGDLEMEVFESVRVSYLLANRKAVVSQRGDGHEDFLEAVAFSDYGELADRCAALVRDDAARRELGQRGFEVMSKRSEGEYLKAALA